MHCRWSVDLRHSLHLPLGVEEGFEVVGVVGSHRSLVGHQMDLPSTIVEGSEELAVFVVGFHSSPVSLPLRLMVLPSTIKEVLVQNLRIQTSFRASNRTKVRGFAGFGKLQNPDARSPVQGRKHLYIFEEKGQQATKPRQQSFESLFLLERGSCRPFLKVNKLPVM